MSYKIEFKEQAREDIAEIVQWYEKQRNGLGDIFLAEFKQFIIQLSSNPYIYQVRRKNIRLSILKRFPYIIAFQVEQTQVIVYGVFHQHQNSKKIYKRIK